MNNSIIKNIAAIIFTLGLVGCQTGKTSYEEYSNAYDYQIAKQERAKKYFDNYCLEKLETYGEIKGENCQRAYNDIVTTREEANRLTREYKRERTVRSAKERRQNQEVRNLIQLVGGAAAAYNDAQRRNSGNTSSSSSSSSSGPTNSGTTGTPCINRGGGAWDCRSIQ